jgi:protein SCO1/2
LFKNKSVKTLIISTLIMFLTAPAFAGGNTNTSQVAMPAPGGGTYMSIPIPANILNTPLYDTNGNTITLNTFKGKWVVISDFLTTCQEVCPMTSANMQQIAHAINNAKLGAKAKVLEVSVDSWRDTASRLKAYQALFNDNSWTIAGGTQTNITNFLAFFGVSAQKVPYTAADLKGLPVDWQTGKQNTFDINHTDLIMLISPNQKWSWLDLGTPDIGKGTLPLALNKFLDADGKENLVKPEQPTWTTAAVYSALNHYLGSKIK